MIQLTPRIYGRTMQWKISPKNIIQTVSSDPIINSVATDDENLKTYTYTQISNYAGNRTITLPISTSIPAEWSLSNIAYARNYRTDLNFGGKGEMAKGRVDCVGGRLNTNIVLDNPVEGLPQVTVSVTGKSYIVERGSIGYDSYPSWENMQDRSYDLGAWIYNNRSSVQDYLQANYTSRVPLMPFVSSDGYNVGAIFVPYYGDRRQPIASDYWCAFSPGSPQGFVQIATYNAWTVGGSSAATKDVYPVNWNGSLDYKGRLPNVTQKLLATLAPGIDRYHYSLSVDIPIRVAWACASQNRNTFNQTSFLDSFAFLDLVEEITVTLSGRPYNTDDVVYNYSLDSSGNLTDTDIKEDNVHKIENCEFITIPTTMNGQPWTSEMAKTLLTKYQKGKYIVTAQVPAKWAILNNVHINTQMQITTLDGEYIARNGAVCTFEVKNIIKHFEGSTFYYKLQLLEV